MSNCNRECNHFAKKEEDLCYTCPDIAEKQMLKSAPTYDCPKCIKELDAFIEYIPHPEVLYRCHKCEEIFGCKDLKKS